MLMMPKMRMLLSIWTAARNLARWISAQVRKMIDSRERMMYSPSRFRFLASALIASAGFSVFSGMLGSWFMAGTFTLRTFFSLKTNYGAPLKRRGYLQPAGAKNCNNPPESDHSRDHIAEEGENGKTQEQGAFVDLHDYGRAYYQRCYDKT